MVFRLGNQCDELQYLSTLASLELEVMPGVKVGLFFFFLGFFPLFRKGIKRFCIIGVCEFVTLCVCQGILRDWWNWLTISFAHWLVEIAVSDWFMSSNQFPG